MTIFIKLDGINLEMFIKIVNNGITERLVHLGYTKFTYRLQDDDKISCVPYCCYHSDKYYAVILDQASQLLKYWLVN